MKIKNFLSMVIIVISINASTAYGETIKTEREINITADTMVLYSKKNMTVFKGNVKAVNKDTTITSDELKIYYSNKKKTDKISNSKSFKKINAEGNVIIKFKDKTAKAGKALYFSKDEKIILTGQRPLIIDGENRIEGDKITWFIKKEVMEIEKKSKKQIKAIFKNKK